MTKAMTLAAMILVSNPALAVYDANMSGVLHGVLTYADTDSIYIRLTNQPTSHPACNAAYFVIDGSVTSERRKMMLARLLTANASGESINIGYDDVGNCADAPSSGRIRMAIPCMSYLQ